MWETLLRNFRTVDLKRLCWIGYMLCGMKSLYIIITMSWICSHALVCFFLVLMHSCIFARLTEYKNNWINWGIFTWCDAKINKTIVTSCQMKKKQDIKLYIITRCKTNIQRKMSKGNASNVNSVFFRLLEMGVGFSPSFLLFLFFEFSDLLQWHYPLTPALLKYNWNTYY